MESGAQLISAAFSGGTADVERLLSTGGSCSRETLNHALSKAARVGPDGRESSVAITRMLLDAGAEVDFQNDLGETAILNAVRHGNHPLVLLLLQRGANPRLEDKFGESAQSTAWAFQSAAGRGIFEEIKRASSP